MSQGKAKHIVPVPWTCPVCNASNPPDFTHCRLCGVKNPAAKPEDGHTCAGCGHRFGGECCPLCGSKEFLQL